MKKTETIPPGRAAGQDARWDGSRSVSGRRGKPAGWSSLTPMTRPRSSSRPTPPGLLRRAVDVATAGLARLLLRIFFREVEVAGADRIPRGVPLVIVANHMNSLVDPILLLGFSGARPRFLAKSTLWSHPVVAPLL